MKDRPIRTIDELIAENEGKTIEEIASEPWEGPHLISVDMLRAAGALDCPPEWRKSLSAGCKAADDVSSMPLFAAAAKDESSGGRAEPARPESGESAR